jgi:hypothetical protein
MSNSAKLDWVYDLGGLSGKQPGPSDNNTKAVDAVMAAYQ